MLYMSGCGRHFCDKCGEELIHRDHRKMYESSSALGQIVSREGPKNISVADIDLASLKLLKNGNGNYNNNIKKLLRIIEQKQPDHSLKGPQRNILYLIDAIIQHCLSCPKAIDLKLDERSGVYIIRGLIDGAINGKRETKFNGSQIIEKLSNGQKFEIFTHEIFFQFLDPLDRKRRK